MMAGGSEQKSKFGRGNANTRTRWICSVVLLGAVGPIVAAEDAQSSYLLLAVGGIARPEGFRPCPSELMSTVSDLSHKFSQCREDFAYREHSARNMLSGRQVKPLKSQSGAGAFILLYCLRHKGNGACNGLMRHVQF